MPHWCRVSDYYPFGFAKLATSWIADSVGYRYAFNGKENDPTGMGGGGSTYDYGFRIYNAQIARFLSVDPLTRNFPMLTPYQYASNNPIKNIDIDGLEGTDANRKFLFNQMLTAIKNYAIYSAERKYCEKYYNSYNCGTNVAPTDFSGVRNDVRNSAPSWLSDENLVKGVYNFKLDGTSMEVELYMNVSRKQPSVSYVSFTNLIENPNGEVSWFSAEPLYYVKFDKYLPNTNDDNYQVAYMAFHNKEDFVKFKTFLFDNYVESALISMEGVSLPTVTITSNINDNSDIENKQQKNESKQMLETEQEVCFANGTKILTNNGFVEIQEIVLGDTVISYNFEKDKHEVSIVLSIYSFDVSEYTDIYFDSTMASVTSSHPFYSLSINGWKNACDLEIGERIKTLDGEVIVTNLKKQRKMIKVYNICVSNNHNYFVTTKRVLVHNKNY